MSVIGQSCTCIHVDVCCIFMSDSSQPAEANPSSSSSPSPLLLSSLLPPFLPSSSLPSSFPPPSLPSVLLPPSLPPTSLPPPPLPPPPSLLPCLQLQSMLSAWRPLQPEDALELLDYAYQDPNVRAYAVRCLKNFTYGIILLHDCTCIHSSYSIVWVLHVHVYNLLEAHRSPYFMDSLAYKSHYYTCTCRPVDWLYVYMYMCILPVKYTPCIVHVYTAVLVCVCISVCMDTCMGVCVWECVWECVYGCIYMYMYTDNYTCSYFSCLQ